MRIVTTGANGNIEFVSSESILFNSLPATIDVVCDTATCAIDTDNLGTDNLGTDNICGNTSTSDVIWLHLKCAGNASMHLGGLSSGHGVDNYSMSEAELATIVTDNLSALYLGDRTTSSTDVDFIYVDDLDVAETVAAKLYILSINANVPRARSR